MVLYLFCYSDLLSYGLVGRCRFLNIDIVLREEVDVGIRMYRIVGKRRVYYTIN